MTIDKVFKNPTVKQVIFQIQFPNLFYLENKIPDIQLDILKEFPESALIIKQPLQVFNSIKTSEAEKQDVSSTVLEKVWEFKNSKGYTLGISTNSLSIHSTVHKTYANDSCENKFRDTIEYCLKTFQKHVKLPYVTRIGLRYIDECPLTEKTTDNYNASFNSALSLSKFPVENVDELYIRVVKKIDDIKIIYQEIFDYNNNNDPKAIIIDFDGFSTNVEFENCLIVSDKLHEAISNEFENTIKQPIIDYMER